MFVWVCLGFGGFWFGLCGGGGFVFFKKIVCFNFVISLFGLVICSDVLVRYIFFFCCC